VKLALWRKLAATYLLPELPGRWRADGWVLHAEPREWFAPAVIISLTPGGLAFNVNANVQFLPVPRDYWSADNSLQATKSHISWDSPSTVEDAVPVMAEVLTYAREECVPFLDRWATMDGRLAFQRERIAAINAHRGGDLAWQDVNLDEELCYSHLLIGDRAGAERYAEWAARTAQVDPRAWAQQARDRVAGVIGAPDGGLALLQQQADFTRAALHVPT
jgi:hypothetical protein